MTRLTVVAFAAPALVAVVAFAPAVVALAPAAIAAERPYTTAAMAAAQDAGRPIVLHVTASWCSTCAAQAPIVQSLLKEPRFKDLVLLDVDFDRQKDVLRTYDVRVQSTFVAFDGRRPVGRSSGDTDPSSIGRLFAKTETASR